MGGFGNWKLHQMGACNALYNNTKNFGSITPYQNTSVHTGQRRKYRHYHQSLNNGIPNRGWLWNFEITPNGRLQCPIQKIHFAPSTMGTQNMTQARDFIL
jgi:hypothetical protein